MRDAAEMIAAQSASTHASFAERVFGVLANGVRLVAAQIRARRTLARLEHLDDHLLADIGLSRGDVAEIEAAAQGRAVRPYADRLAATARMRRAESRWIVR